MATKSTKGEARPLLSPNDDGRGLEDFEEISHYCLTRASSSEHASTGDDVRGLKSYEEISYYCVEKESSFEPASAGLELTKENIGSFDNNRDIKQLATNAQNLNMNTSGRRVSAPDKKCVFQDKSNVEGKKRIDSKKKHEGEGKMLRQKLTKSQKRITELQNKINQKDADAVEKDKELKEMSTFMTTLQDLLQDMACGDELQMGTSSQSSNIARELNGMLYPLSADDSNKLRVTLKEREKEISGLNERISQLLESFRNQGSVICSLKSLNVDSEQTMKQMMQLIDEKDQALAGILQFNEMNDCANRALLAHAHKNQQDAMRKVRTKHEKDMTSLKDENTQLLESMASQASLIHSLKSLSIDSEQTMSSLMQLIDEKDKALEAMSSFNDMNDCANSKLLLHAYKTHEDEQLEHEMRMKSLQSIICLQLRERNIHQMKLEQMKQQIDEGSEMNRQYVEEVKFMLTIMSLVSILMALVWQKECFFYISPVYFLFVFYNLE